jgi:hypothetical protein
MRGHKVQLWNEHSARLINVKRLVIEGGLPNMNGITVYMSNDVPRKKRLLGVKKKESIR